MVFEFIFEEALHLFCVFSLQCVSNNMSLSHNYEDGNQLSTFLTYGICKIHVKNEIQILRLSIIYCTPLCDLAKHPLFIIILFKLTTYFLPSH